MNLVEILVEKLEKEKLWEEEIYLKRNEFLKEENTTDSNLYYIISGSLRIFIRDNSEEKTIRFGYEKNIIAALDSFIHEGKSVYCIQALKKTTLKRIYKKTFMNFIQKSEENKSFWGSILLYHILQQMEREKDLLIASPLERYQRVLKRSPQLFQEIPHKFIANYLRMSPETLSRLKKS
ncbi:Crp/Fnr family transcriptional regulator [Aureivirga marina]|uniref:Crp/Fnr family transcriptional regulator n=1 Tax=Aureivirga marina TaxID=1182451 RepID=UPI0018C985D5|nr:Crp/Fnr family transcriptional regulator [Aureivirga marina]